MIDFHLKSSKDITMDGSGYTVTLEEHRLFHGIDRRLYTILVRDLWRNPIECLQIMGLWVWLERGGFSNIINKMLYLPQFLINEFADEAVLCLKCLIGQFPFLSESAAEIPLTHALVKKEISLQFFHENRFTALREVLNLVTEVCIPALSDLIMDIPVRPTSSSSANQIMRASSSLAENSRAQNISGLNIGGLPPSSSRGRSRANETPRYERTMFVTFSKGYPVAETEVRLFFKRILGNCIESFHMQEVRSDEQALYARIVFLSPKFINLILNGVNKAKFNINGKHVWMRRFVPKEVRVLASGFPGVGPSNGPH